MLILATTHLDITLDHFFFFYSFYISACDLVFVVVCLCVLRG